MWRLVFLTPESTSHNEEVTTVDPLNLALTAKSKQRRIWWWLVTIVAFVALAFSVYSLILNYKKKDTSVVVTVSHFIYLETTM